MPGNRIRPKETMHVTQKTDRTHHISSPPRVWVLVSLFAEGSTGVAVRAARRHKLEEFGGSSLRRSVQPVAVYSSSRWGVPGQLERPERMSVASEPGR
jgi:hypothetical protein